MGFFYFDESIHSNGKFVLGAFIYSERDLDPIVGKALRESGLTPLVDEFKSGARMDASPGQRSARGHLRSVVRECCQIGIVVAPDSPRNQLGAEALCGLEKILSTNQFKSSQHQVFFDEGIFPRSRVGVSKTNLAGFGLTYFFERDSKQVLGLQLADLIAHTCAIMLCAELGLVRKTVKAGEASGYDPNMDMELEFELWAGVRYNFFAAEPLPVDEWESQLDFQVDVQSRGLHVAPTCDQNVKAAALSRFGTMYLGCIH